MWPRALSLDEVSTPAVRRSDMLTEHRSSAIGPPKFVPIMGIKAALLQPNSQSGAVNKAGLEFKTDTCPRAGTLPEGPTTSIPHSLVMPNKRDGSRADELGSILVNAKCCNASFRSNSPTTGGLVRYHVHGNECSINLRRAGGHLYHTSRLQLYEGRKGVKYETAYFASHFH